MSDPIDFPIPADVGETFEDDIGVIYVCRVVGPPAVWSQDVSGVAPGGNFVTLDTAQTIDGAKTFEASQTKFGPNSNPGATIDADGSGGFNNVKCSAGASAFTQVDADGISLTGSAGSPTGTFNSSGILMGGTLPSLPNITLNASDGSLTTVGDATFGTDVSVSGDISITGSTTATFDDGEFDPAS